jgi:hypothetical protein
MNSAYVRHALVTAFRAARFETGVTDAFDNSFEGFYRSFFASVVSLPFYVFLVYGQERMLGGAGEPVAEPGPAASGAGYYLIEAFAFAVDWLAMPLAMIGVVRLLKANHRYVPFVVAYNWGNCVVYAAFAVPLTAYFLGFASSSVMAILYYGVLMFVLSYRWRLARETLRISSLNAAAVVIIDVLLGVLIDLLTARLHKGLL